MYELIEMIYTLIYDFFDGLKITKREIIASVSLVALLLIIGLNIAGGIEEKYYDQQAIYNKAVKVENTDVFTYSMKTNVGNAFVYGDLKAVDTVSYDEVDGEYMYIEKVKERYTMHTRTVTTTVNGKTQTRTETYWTWDVVGRESKKSAQVSFCDVSFDSSKFDLPSADYLDTIKESSHVRYKYYVVDKEMVGTIFTELKDETISDNSAFYKNQNIDETMESLKSNNPVVWFWIGWVIFSIIILLVFFRFENYWLED
jgi:hypothetical protein